MAIPSENPSTQPQAAQPSEKEVNFRKLEERYEKMLQDERQKRLEAEAEIQKRSSPPTPEDEEEDSEPYVDRRRLKKELTQFATKSKQETQSEIQKAVQEALSVERQNNWLKDHADFEEVMSHAETFATKDPEWAKEFMELKASPFEKQKLVYKSIKAMGIHKKEEPKPSIQQEIQNNKKSLYYNPSGMGSAPYQSQSDFSPAGQKSAYDKMQELKARIRL